VGEPLKRNYVVKALPAQGADETLQTGLMSRKAVCGKI